MRHVHITLDDEEVAALERVKDRKTWKELLLSTLDYLDEKLCDYCGSAPIVGYVVSYDPASQRGVTAVLESGAETAARLSKSDGRSEPPQTENLAVRKRRNKPVEAESEYEYPEGDRWQPGNPCPWEECGEVLETREQLSKHMEEHLK